MTIKNISLAILGFSAMAIMLIVGIFEFSRPSASLPKCPNNSVPTHHSGECRELLPIETDTTFPWDRQQSEAKDFFRKFQKGVATDRRREVAGMMMYPLRVNYYDDPKPKEYRFLSSPAELIRDYDKIFDKSVKNYIAKYDPEEVSGNDYFLQTGYGEIGIYCTTIGQCPECEFKFEVKIIASNSIHRDAITASITDFKDR